MEISVDELRKLIGGAWTAGNNGAAAPTECASCEQREKALESLYERIRLLEVANVRLYEENLELRKEVAILKNEPTTLWQEDVQKLTIANANMEAMKKEISSHRAEMDAMAVTCSEKQSLIDVLSDQAEGLGQRLEQVCDECVNIGQTLAEVSKERDELRAEYNTAINLAIKELDFLLKELNEWEAGGGMKFLTNADGTKRKNEAHIAYSGLSAATMGNT